MRRSESTLREPPAFSPKVLYAIDAWSSDEEVHDVVELVAIARDAVEAGGGHCLRDCLVEFPNGAVTLVLILAESHLSIHTWPEESLVAIDLFSCGRIDGDAVIRELTSRLRLRGVSTRRMERGADATPVDGVG
ncbi:MAG TPA: adenosylmethionine decarboxylase [Candidatus Dormibacteraeota bacterium]|jgi:S-adenosylmethionine decarboxylase